MKTLIWHLGLGDAIICAPIAVKLAQFHRGLAVPCWRRNLLSVKVLFVDYPEIEVFPIDSEAELPNTSPETILMGYYNKGLPRLEGENFDLWFFRQMDMDIVKDQEFCPIRKMFSVPKYIEVIDGPIGDEKPYLFIHEDLDRGFLIHPERLPALPHVKPRDKSFSILENAIMISLADEVHCIDSSFLHLTEKVPTRGKLFYHKYARPNSENITFSKPWTILE